MVIIDLSTLSSKGSGCSLMLMALFKTRKSDVNYIGMTEEDV